MQALREKLDKARLDSLQESEETMNEMRNVYEREKLMLMEENKKLQVGGQCGVCVSGIDLHCHPAPARYQGTTLYMLIRLLSQPR